MPRLELLSQRLTSSVGVVGTIRVGWTPILMVPTFALGTHSMGCMHLMRRLM